MNLLIKRTTSPKGTNGQTVSQMSQEADRRQTDQEVNNAWVATVPIRIEMHDMILILWVSMWSVVSMDL